MSREHHHRSAPCWFWAVFHKWLVGFVLDRRAGPVTCEASCRWSATKRHHLSGDLVGSVPAGARGSRRSGVAGVGAVPAGGQGAWRPDEVDTAAADRRRSGGESAAGSRAGRAGSVRVPATGPRTVSGLSWNTASWHASVTTCPDVGVTGRQVGGGDPLTCRFVVERVTGIEPAWPAWKAGALPLSYTRAPPPVRRRSSGRPGPATT